MAQGIDGSESTVDTSSRAHRLRQDVVVGSLPKGEAGPGTTSQPSVDAGAERQVRLEQLVDGELAMQGRTEPEPPTILLGRPREVALRSADGRSLALPTREQFDLILAQAETYDELAQLERMVAACSDFTRRCHSLKHHFAEQMAFRLRTRHKIGLLLLQVERRGGNRSKRQRATLLKDKELSIDSDTAKRCRRTASVPKLVMEEYLKRRLDKDNPPSEAGLLRFGAQSGKLGKPSKKRTTRKLVSEEAPVTSISPTALGLVQRVLGEIDLCVGTADIDAKLQVSASTVQPKQLRGRVFVAECLEPDEWIAKLTGLHAAAQLEEVIIALPPTPCTQWFKRLIEKEWTCCFMLEPPGLCLGYKGRGRAFEVVGKGFGVVVGYR